MAKGLNKVMLIGHLGSDPEIRYGANGMAIATLSVATNSATKDKQTGQWQDVTEWHRVVLFDKLAEVAGQYLRKGSQVYIEGRLQTRKWQDQSGQDRYTTEIVGNEMQMLGGRSESVPANNPPAANYNALPHKPENYNAPSATADVAKPTSQTPPAYNNPPSGSFDDDVPF